MNMKKILFAGIAIGALASTGANAATIDAARISSVNLFTAPGGGNSNVARPITIASEAIYDAGRNTAAVITTGGFGPGSLASSSNAYSAKLNNIFPADGTFRPNPGAPGVNRSWKATFVFDGAGDPRFVSAIANGNYVANVATSQTTLCTVSTFNNIAGGGVNGNFATAIFTVTDVTGSGCNSTNAPTGVSLIDAPIKLNALGAANLTVTFRNLGDDSVFDTPGSAALVQLASVYDVGASSIQNGTGFGNGAVIPTVFEIGNSTPIYTRILNATGYDANIGAIKATYKTAADAAAANASTGVPLGVGTANTVATFFAGLATTALPTIAPNALFTNVGGQFNALLPAVTGLTVTPVVVGGLRPTATGTAANSALGLAAVNVTATTVGGNTTSVASPQSTTVAIQAIASALLNPSATVTSPLELIGQQGTVINAPWFGGSRAVASSVVRLSSAAGTGGVSLTLNNPLYQTGDTPGATTCNNAFTSIPAGGEVVIDVTRVTSCFGNFRRGDLQIVVNGSQSGLTAKMRVANPDGSISELSLSNLPATQVTNN